METDLWRLWFLINGFENYLTVTPTMLLTAEIFLKMQHPNLDGAFFSGLLFLLASSLWPGIWVSGCGPVLDKLTSKCSWFLLSEDIHWRNISFRSFSDLLPLRVESLSTLFERQSNYMRANSWTWNKQFVKRLQTLILPSQKWGLGGEDRVSTLWLANTSLIFHLGFFSIRFSLGGYQTTLFKLNHFNK